jgi:hypothetical protein
MNVLSAFEQVALQNKCDMALILLNHAAQRRCELENEIAGLRASEPTLAMIDAPRGFLMGLESGQTTLESMRDHLRRIGDSIESWPAWAREESGHITKAGQAIIIYAMMKGAM